MKLWCRALLLHAGQLTLLRYQLAQVCRIETDSSDCHIFLRLNVRETVLNLRDEIPLGLTKHLLKVLIR